MGRPDSSSPSEIDPARRAALQDGYTRVAAEYARRIYDELQHKPIDRTLLDRLAVACGDGLVCDLGCGPGHVARYLHERGTRACGLDLAYGMVAQAKALNPDLAFMQGDMTALGVADHAWAGVAAFYSLIHVPRPALPRALGEIRRALRPGGILLAAFHVGTETIHLDEWWEERVNLDFFFFEPREITEALSGAGFVVDEVVEREPYPDVEHASRRAYVLARTI